MPLGVSPSQVVEACLARRDRRRREIIDLSLATSNLILAGFSTQRVEPMQSLRHLFTKDEYDEAMRQIDEQRQVEAQMQQIAMLKAMWGQK